MLNLFLKMDGIREKKNQNSNIHKSWLHNSTPASKNTEELEHLEDGFNLLKAT